MVGQSRHCGKSGALLSTALGAGSDEEAGVFAPVGTGLPLAAGGVPEGLPLGGEVSVAGGDAEEEGVVLLQCLGGG